MFSLSRTDVFKEHLNLMVKNGK